MLNHQAITTLPGLLNGDIALVTGAARGNGAAIARGLAASGARVALADLDLAGCESLAAELTQQGHQAAAFALDVADRAACRATAAAIEAALGPVSILVNSAGILRRAHPAEPQYLEELDQLLTVNATGSANMAIACLDQLRRTKGRVVNIASIAALITNPGTTHYSASKGAVMQLTKGLAAELAKDGIRVNAIAPAVIATAMTAPALADPAVRGRFEARTPMGRVGEAEELVGPVLFLASALSTYVTGAILPVDGGYLSM
ncbi:glucose 1-dehydrogenase [Siccirubricoccus sp. KC 17139]|uniref:Glucose 1-dehydrogenase n=1 Tax=Siccirubricoccus soli TaxID=2899147 RepID=A0ABT1DBT8_9PROT|nr:glucose 1-dehydrogenase [Siccirubricoccus soli]MCO6419407.1 glucose 1-dehydrogenase [Siccirubricoccus soli]MCP2685542.1 glucose 1-dehydrogenase [Siccirubricoccus soli]